MNNDNTFCPGNMTSCYHYSASATTYTAATTACQAMGGNVVSWNSDPEQLMVGPAGAGACAKLIPLSGRFNCQRAAYIHTALDAGIIGLASRRRIDTAVVSLILPWCH